MVACDIATSGEADTDADDVAGDWERTGFNLASDAWVVFSADGTIVGYGDVWRHGELARLNPNTGVHPAYTGHGIGTWLLQRAEQWTRDNMLGPGIIEHVVLNQYVLHSNASALALLEQEGYRPVRYHWRMEIDLQAEPAEPESPSGILIRQFISGQDDAAAHAAIEEAFEDSWGHAYHPFEDWQNSTVRRANFYPPASFLALDGSEIAGSAMSFDYSPVGWVRQVGVRRGWRRRGIALALLVKVFREFYRRGFRRVGLGVDSESLTGANQLYLRAGMRVVRQFDQVQKELRRSG